MLLPVIQTKIPVTSSRAPGARYTLFLPRDSLTPPDIPFEQAMRLVLTGAITKGAEESVEAETKQNGEGQSKDHCTYAIYQSAFKLSALIKPRKTRSGIT